MKKELKDFLHFYLGCEGIVNDNKLEIVKLEGICNTKGGYKVNTRISHGLMYWYDVIVFKPILRPLSDMTEHEYDEWDNIHPLISGTSELIISEAEKTKYLLSKHFDLFGLIEAGIAIDATTIKAEI